MDQIVERPKPVEEALGLSKGRVPPRGRGRAVAAVAAIVLAAVGAWYFFGTAPATPEVRFETVAAARAAFPADPWSIAALHVVTTLTGSALLALALLHRVRDPDAIWAAAHVDEDWNIEKWGIDEEVAARRAAREVDFRAATQILKALKG